MTDTIPPPPRTLARRGMWLVPPEERPANWRTMGLREPTSEAEIEQEPEPHPVRSGFHRAQIAFNSRITGRNR